MLIATQDMTYVCSSCLKKREQVCQDLEHVSSTVSTSTDAPSTEWIAKAEALGEAGVLLTDSLYVFVTPTPNPRFRGSQSRRATLVSGLCNLVRVPQEMYADAQCTGPLRVCGPLTRSACFVEWCRVREGPALAALTVSLRWSHSGVVVGVLCAPQWNLKGRHYVRRFI